MGFDWIGNLESDLFAVVVDAGADPLVGWLTSFLGDKSEPAYTTLTSELATITSEIQNGFAVLKREITDGELLGPVTDSEGAASFGTYPLISAVALDFQTINNILAGIDPQFE